MKPLLIILSIILVMYLLKVFVLDQDNKNEAQTSTSSGIVRKANPKVPVDIYVANLQVQKNVVYASGTIIPNEEVEIKSEVSGRLDKLNIKEGSYISKGTLIAKLNDDDLISQLKKLKKLNYEEELAHQIEVRQGKLLEIDAISKEEYDMAVNKVNTLKVDKEILEIQIEKSQVRAPFSGRMGLKNISEGAYITPTVVIAKLIQKNPLKIDFSIPEKYASKIKVGQSVTFRIDGNDEVFDSKVIAIDPQIDEELRTLKVRSRTQNKNGELFPGMFVRVDVPLGSEDLIMIPSQAIVPILKGKKVYVMEDGKAKEVEITTGLRTEEKVQVESGLTVGDSLIVSALMSMKNGVQVALRNVIPKSL